MKLEDFEYKKVKGGYRVKIHCVNCGKELWEKWYNVQHGIGKYCSKECYDQDRFHSDDDLSKHEKRISSSRHIEVKINCQNCGKETWVRWNKVKKGWGLYCSRTCSNQDKPNTWDRQSRTGKTNAGISLDKRANRYLAYWDDEKGKRHNLPYARWWWEVNKGEIPDGYYATHADENWLNINDNNICIHPIEEYGKRMSKMLEGHEVSLETRQKISMGHTGKEEFDGFSEQSNYPGLSKARKIKVKRRDKFTCQICKEPLKHSGRSVVHHIDGDKNNQDMKNLILVCIGCHALIHCKKDVPTEILAFRSMLHWNK